MSQHTAMAWDVSLSCSVYSADRRQDVLCARDPLPAMLRLLYDDSSDDLTTDMVAPVNQGKGVGEAHTFDAFTLVRATARTKAVFAHMRDVLATTPASWAAFDELGGSMGMYSTAIEQLYERDGFV